MTPLLTRTHACQTLVRSESLWHPHRTCIIAGLTENTPPGTARANLAPTLETPRGSTAWAAAHSHQTVLEAHVNFFDSDSDGVIWPLDTYRAFRALGFNVLISTVAFIGLHATLSYVTVDGYLPDPCFRMYVRNIHKVKHGSDTGAFDNEGRFIPQK